MQIVLTEEEYNALKQRDREADELILTEKRAIRQRSADEFAQFLGAVYSASYSSPYGVDRIAITKAVNAYLDKILQD